MDLDNNEKENDTNQVEIVTNSLPEDKQTKSNAIN
jgi:hypothetical protein